MTGLAITVALVILGLGVGLSSFNPWGLFVGGYATGWLIDRDSGGALCGGAAHLREDEKAAGIVRR